jgi:two-component system chemotaxis response regulator CheB
MTMGAGKIKVLIVEDLISVQLVLIDAIESDLGLTVVGTVNSGERALKFLEGADKPDVILMDIHLPGMNGFETTHRIMSTKPLPIVICSATSDPADVATTFRAMDAGAVAMIAKPRGPMHPLHGEMKQHLLQTLKLMSEVKVVRRWKRQSGAVTPVTPNRDSISPGKSTVKLVVIGTSTGGPPVLRSILGALSKEFPVPILVVQHISPGFLAGLVEWLQQGCQLKVLIAGQGDVIMPGHVYFAPDGCHMGVDSQGRIALANGSMADALRPSASHLFRTVAEVYGASAVGVLLTGMGKDGAHELSMLKDRGAVTIAQDKATSVVHGMPGEAIRLGAAVHILASDQIAGMLKRILNLS